jgi:hypothetical protein
MVRFRKFLTLEKLEKYLKNFPETSKNTRKTGNFKAQFPIPNPEKY